MIINNLQALIDLQDVDGRIRELEREAKDLPRRKALESARMKGVNAELDVAKNQLAAVEKTIANCEDEAKAARDRIQELKIAQSTASSNKEYTQLMITIEGLESEADAADNRQAALMDNIDGLKKKVETAEAKAGAEKGGVDGFCAELDERLAAVKSELDALAEERKGLAAKVPARSLLYYERLRTKRWPVVVPLNSDSVCEGCHLKVPPSTEQMVEHKMELVACTNCGRMLYRDL